MVYCFTNYDAMFCSILYLPYIYHKIQKQTVNTYQRKITIQRNQIENIATELKENNEMRVNFFTGIFTNSKHHLPLYKALDSLKDLEKSKGNKSSYELEMINKNSNRLLRLIENLLDFRKVENKPFNLRGITDQYLRFFLRIVSRF